VFWADYNCTLLIESLVMVADRAGNTLRHAALIQPRAKFSSRQDAIGRTDKDDYYKFKFARSSGLQLSLSGLKADVDLALLNSKGRVLQKSSQRGTGDEFLIPDNLKAGTYYIRVYQRSSNTAYKLSFATSPAGHKEHSPLTAADSGSVDNGAFDYLGGSDDGSIIDLMVVYTAKARQAEGGVSTINAVINRVVNEVNEGYANSGVIPRIRLVHTAEVNYAERSNSNLDLNRLQNRSDGYMDEVHNLRNQYGADIVSLFTENLEPGIGGRAYVMQNVSPSFESSAFNVVQTFSAKYGFALGHEIGHNLGAAHDRANAQVSGAYPYSYGYITPTGIGDVMSYALKRKNYYSSPNIVVEGQPLGRANSEDVVQTFNNVRLTAANWRKSVIAVNTTPTITLSASDPIAAEVPAGQLLNPGQFTLTRTGSTTSPLTVNYVVSGTATNVMDYSVLGGAVTFAAGSQTATIAVNPIHETTAEGNETVVLKLMPSTDYTFGTNSSAIVTIEDDNQPTVTIGATDSTAAETTSGQTPNPGQFTLTRTGNTASALTVNYSLAGTATNGTDYAFLNGGVTFGAGSSIATISVSPIDDSIVEASETVTVSLASSSTYMLGATTSANILIADNDTPTPVDNAGNTLATARAIAGGATQIFNDFVGDADTDDFYQLNVGSDRYFSLTLSGLSANANVQLIQDSNGNGIIDAKETLALSQLSGSASESFNLPILAGSYYVRVYQGGTGNNTNYNLSFTVTGLGTASYIDPSPVQSYFGTGVTRSFFNGTEPGYPSIYQSSNGKYVMHGAIAGYYTDNNFLNPNLGNGLYGVYSGLGLPTTPSYVQANGTQVMEFEGGSLFAQGNSITVSYNQRNGDRFDLVGVGAPAGTELFWKNDYSYWSRQIGAPTSTVRRITNGWIQEFSVNNSVSNIFLLKDGQQPLGGFESYTNDLGQSTQVPAGGPYRVGGAFLGVYLSVGGYTRQTGGLGLPTMSIERRDYSGYKIYQAFENGFIAQTYSDQVVIRNWQGAPITP